MTNYSFRTANILVRLDQNNYCVTNLEFNLRGVQIKGPVNNEKHFLELHAFFTAHRNDTYSQIFHAIDALKRTNCYRGDIDFAVTISG